MCLALVVLAGCVDVLHEQNAAWYTKGHGVEIKEIATDALARAEPGTPEARRWELVSFHAAPIVGWQKAELRLKGAPPDMPDVPRVPEDRDAVKIEREALEEMNVAVDEAQAAGGAGGLLGWILGVAGVAGGGGIGALLLRVIGGKSRMIGKLVGALNQVKARHKKDVVAATSGDPDLGRAYARYGRGETTAEAPAG
jgi:hypothetical protein